MAGLFVQNDEKTGYRIGEIWKLIRKNELEKWGITVYNYSITVGEN